MTSTNNSNVKVKKSRFDFDSFDRFPLHCKEIIWNATHNIHTKQPWPRSANEAMLAQLRKIDQKETLRAYGPSHPQSGQRELCAADLSFDD
jgi:hypothetical protein